MIYIICDEWQEWGSHGYEDPAYYILLKSNTIDEFISVPIWNYRNNPEDIEENTIRLARLIQQSYWSDSFWELYTRKHILGVQREAVWNSKDSKLNVLDPLKMLNLKIVALDDLLSDRVYLHLIDHVFLNQLLEQ